jgi:hypothetical protein
MSESTVSPREAVATRRESSQLDNIADVRGLPILTEAILSCTVKDIYITRMRTQQIRTRLGDKNNELTERFMEHQLDQQRTSQVKWRHSTL